MRISQAFSTPNYRFSRGVQLKKEGESLPQLEEGLAQARFEREKYVALEEQFKTYKDKLIEKTEKRKEEERKLKVMRSGCFLSIQQKM